MIREKGYRMNRPVIGISSCLLGNEVRYDGGHKLMHYLRDTLGKFVDFVPVCPEMECGMGVPRESLRLVQRDGDVRLITNKTKADKTDQMRSWAVTRTGDLSRENLCGFIFKSKSPSCGVFRVKEYDENGITKNNSGRGIFAEQFIESLPLIPIEEDGRLHDAPLRENFIARVFAVHRWHELCEEPKTIHALTQFYASYKYTLMAHDPKVQKELGSLIGNGKELPSSELYDQFLPVFLNSLKNPATTKKNTNVLEHIMGYFKRHLTAEEKAELKTVISQYHDHLIPLIVPITLLKHYVYKYKSEYLMKQYYLSPHPMELMLRNHV